MRLIDTTTGKEIVPGDKVKTFRGDEATLVSFDARRVYIQFTYGWKQEFFPSIIGAKIEIEETNEEKIAPVTGGAEEMTLLTTGLQNVIERIEELERNAERITRLEWQVAGLLDLHSRQSAPSQPPHPSPPIEVIHPSALNKAIRNEEGGRIGDRLAKALADVVGLYLTGGLSANVVGMGRWFMFASSLLEEWGSEENREEERRRDEAMERIKALDRACRNLILAYHGEPPNPEDIADNIEKKAVEEALEILKREERVDRLPPPVL